MKGTIAFQQYTRDTVIQFRKIEIKELPADKSEGPSAAVAPFDAAKAQEHQQAWAKHLGVPVEDTNSIGMKLRLIPPGEFTMGNADENPFALPEDKSQHRVRITRPFLMGTHEVTVGQFREFINATRTKTHAETDPRGGQVADETGYHRVAGTNWLTPGFPQTDDHPVTCVTWAEAVAFCEWLSKKEGVTYRLPTDAEWEYACRGGTTTAYYYGPKADPKMAVMQRWGKLSGSQPVGSVPANPFGLSDMLGNVYEWCQDGRRKYTVDPATDPVGPAGPKDDRVRRGGGWSSALDQKSGALSGGRTVGPPDTEAAHTIGFRVVRVGDPKAKPAAVTSGTAVVKPLRDAVGAMERNRDAVKARFDAGLANRLELIAAEIELIEARIRVAQAEGHKPAVVKLLEELVAQRQAARDVVAVQVMVGTARRDELDKADALAAEAKARLAQADGGAPPVVAPDPRPKR